MDLVNTGGTDRLSSVSLLMFTDHGVPLPGAGDLAALLPGCGGPSTPSSAATPSGR